MNDTTERNQIRAWEGFALWMMVFVLAGVVYVSIDPESCETGVACDLRRAAGLGLLGLLFSAGIWIWMKVVHGQGPGALGLRPVTRNSILVGIGYGLGGRFLAAVTEAATFQITKAIRGAEPEIPEQVELPDSPTLLFWAGVAVAVVVLAPYAEELLFRGLIYLGLRNRLGVPAAIVLSSLFFGLTHIEPLIIPALFVFGVVLARLRESRDDVTPAIIAHATFNLIGFVALYVTS